MKKLLKQFNCTFFDVASGPVVLAFFGIAVVIAITAVVLIILSILLIRKALRKKKAEEVGNENEKIR